MTTTGEGKTYCDACIKSYFWNSLYSKARFAPADDEGQCVDCCVRCADVCDVDDEDGCVACDEDGTVLETLDVKRGWYGCAVSNNAWHASAYFMSDQSTSFSSQVASQSRIAESIRVCFGPVVPGRTLHGRVRAVFRRPHWSALRRV